MRSASVWDYPYYGIEYVCKTDAKPKFLKRFGIVASQKEIDAVLDLCHDGWTATGGHGHIKHVKLYSVTLLKKYLIK